MLRTDCPPLIKGEQYTRLTMVKEELSTTENIVVGTASTATLAMMPPIGDNIGALNLFFFFRLIPGCRSDDQENCHAPYT